jgi:excisionase family DNA binding protein
MGTKKRQVEAPLGLNPSIGSPLLDIEAAAMLLGTSRRHVQRLVSERRIPFLRVGRFIRFDQASLKAWLDQHRVEPKRALSREYAPRR